MYLLLLYGKLLQTVLFVFCTDVSAAPKDFVLHASLVKSTNTVETVPSED